MKTRGLLFVTVLAIVWLSTIEGQQAYLIGLPPVDPDLYKETATPTSLTRTQRLHSRATAWIDIWWAASLWSSNGAPPLVAHGEVQKGGRSLMAVWPWYRYGKNSSLVGSLRSLRISWTRD